MEQSLRTKSQNTQLFALLNTLKITHLRNDLAMQYSNGRTSSTKKLYESECEELIGKLSKMVEEQGRQQTPRAILKMRRRFFAVCHELGWELSNGKLDYARINRWLLRYGVHKKSINAYTAKELPELISQIDALLKSKLEHGNQDFKIR